MELLLKTPLAFEKLEIKIFISIFVDDENRKLKNGPEHLPAGGGWGTLPIC